MEEADLQGLTKTALDWADKSKRISDLRATLEGHYDPNLFEQNCVEIDSFLNESSGRLLHSIRRSQPRAYLAEDSDLEINLENSRQALSEVSEAATDLARALDEPTPSTTGACRRLAEIGAIAASDPKPTLEWFDWSVLGKLREQVDQATGKSAELATLRARLSGDWGDGYFKLPLAEWHEDFAFRFAKPWRILQPEYRRRRKRLQHSHKSLKKLTYVDMREVITQGAKILELDEWFGRRREEHTRLLGFHYRGSETRWEEVAVHIESVRTLLEMKRGSRASHNSR